MRILIVAATAAEITPFSDFLHKKNKKARRPVDVLITGVGMVATAYSLGRQLATGTPYDLIVNVGIAGSFDRSVPRSTIVRITQDTFAELGAEDDDEFLTITDLGFGKNTFYESFTDTLPLFLNLPTCKGLTVNRVHGNDESIRRLLSRFPNAQTESMEGAAVFYAAAESGIPAIQIRAISNYVERRDKTEWQIRPAVDTLNDWLANFIDRKIP